MMILFAIIGFGVGWLLNLLATVLPRLTRHRAVVQQPVLMPAAVRLVARREPLTPEVGMALGAEGISLLVFVYLGLRFGWTIDFAAAAAVYSFFALIALVDLKYRLVLNLVVYPAILFVLLLQWATGGHTPTSILLGGGLAFGMFALAAWVKPGGLGGGDVKLALLIGLALGFPQVLWALIVGVGVGAVVALWLLGRGRTRQTYIPYAPFLCLGAMIALLYNPIVI
jgi:leader peptidase (prepilin peptidase)/N-methyltransferase